MKDTCHDRSSQRFAFQQNTRFGDVFDLIERDGGDVKTTLPFGDGERVGEQQRQRFAQGACTDAVVILAVFDTEFFARSQPVRLR